MNKKTKQPIRPNGIYGGETNGANPLEWSLRSTICAQLRAAGYWCEMDAFGDKSGSWIGVYKNEDNPRDSKVGKRMFLSVQFNWDGNIMTGIKVFEETLSLSSDGTKGIF